jgi:cob(I)alamin adenosyltransferase
MSDDAERPGPEPSGPEASGPEASGDAAWAARMAARQALQETRLAARTREQGLLMVHTGNGKGKTTAALGLILRMAGQGLAVGMVQFVKSPERQPGELAALARFADLVEIRVMGQGFTWDTQDRARDTAAAQAAWTQARAMLAEPRYRLVVLDELTIALRHGFLPVAEIVAALTARRPDLHVVVTGRHAPPDLIAAADLVTEMRAVRHPFQDGIKAQVGIEF